MKKRLVASLIVAVLSALVTWAAQTYVTAWPGGDFSQSILAARDLLAGLDPYARRPDSYWVPYPLPAAFVALPFSFCAMTIGAALFMGVSAGLLAFGLTRDGNFDRLLIFDAMPFWFALVWAQWTPFIMAAAFIPALLPVVLIKPQIALPVALTRLTRIGIYCCIAVGLLSLAIYPTWPLVWLSQIGQYQKFFPILSLPFGPFLLLALLRWRDKDARLLLLAALMPQRMFYDAFILWLIPKTKREMLATVTVSWGAWLWKLAHPEMTSEQFGFASVLFFFLPMLCVVLSRSPGNLFLFRGNFRRIFISNQAVMQVNERLQRAFQSKSFLN